MKMLRLILPLFLLFGGAAFAQQGGGVVGKPPFTGCATWSSTNILTGTGVACGGGGGSGITIGTTTITSGTSGRVLYDSAGVVGELATTGSGSVVLATAPTLTGPAIINEAVGSSALTLTGATQTSSFPVLSATQTWNNAATVFTAWKLNVTDTASNALSLLQDWQVGGTSKAGVIKTGEIYSNMGFFYSAAKSYTSSAPTGMFFQSPISATLFADDLAYMNWTNFSNAGRLITLHQSAAIGFAITPNILSGSDASFSRISSGIIGVGNNGLAGNVAGGLQLTSITGANATLTIGTYSTNTLQFQLNSSNFMSLDWSAGVRLGATWSLGWSNSSSDSLATIDTIIRRAAAATLQLGAADASSAVAQTLQVQSVVAGTSNAAGADFSIYGSKSTGTGAGGSIKFYTSPAGSTGSAQNAGTLGLTITSAKSVVLNNAAIATNATDGFLYIASGAGTPTGVPTANTGRVALYYDTTNHQFWIYDGAWLQPKTPAGAATVTWQ